MNPQHQQAPDMNAVFRAIADQAIADAAGKQAASILVTAGTTLRAQGFGINAAIDMRDVMCPPALLDKEVSLLLLPYLKHINGTYRLLVQPSPVPAAEGEPIKRIYTAFNENEGNLRESTFVNLTPEHIAELDRQLVKMEAPADYLGLFCVAILGKAIEGYQYFTPEVAPTAEGVKTEEAVAGAAAPAASAELANGLIDAAAPQATEAAEAGGVNGSVPAETVAPVAQAAEQVADPVQ